MVLVFNTCTSNAPIDPNSQISLRRMSLGCVTDEFDSFDPNRHKVHLTLDPLKCETLASRWMKVSVNIIGIFIHMTCNIGATVPK